MTPAIKAARAAGVSVQLHEYAHDPANTQYGMEAAQVLGIEPARVFKTLVVKQNADDRRLAVAA